MSKLQIGILFGGKSPEHDVSIQSAKSIYQESDKNKYDVTLIGIDTQGIWHHISDPAQLMASTISDINNVTGSMAPLEEGNQTPLLHDINMPHELATLDVIFPVLHGPMGEDGTVQGLLSVLGIPFVGAGVLGSAVGMDKDVMKRLLRDQGIPIADFLVFHKYQIDSISYSDVINKLGNTVFVKPANLGSSIGVSKATSQPAFQAAIAKAFSFDTKILIERAILGKEIECAILGNDHPIASTVGEIVPRYDFYSYDAKYLDENGADFVIPASLPDHLKEKVQVIARKAFTALCCRGMARIDCFVTHNSEVFVNEINTIPGFTKISMYPKLWNASGIGYTELIDRLIQLALENHHDQSSLLTIRA